MKDKNKEHNSLHSYGWDLAKIKAKLLTKTGIKTELRKIKNRLKNFKYPDNKQIWVDYGKADFFITKIL